MADIVAHLSRLSEKVNTYIPNSEGFKGQEKLCHCLIN